MARKVDIEYVRFYTDGTAAKRLEPKPPKIKAPKPKAKPKKRIRIYIDPVAVLGVLVAGVMLVLMAVGVNRLKAAQRETAAMEQYIAALQIENDSLRETYENGYDLETVERLAKALGMVPKEQLQHIPVALPPQEPEAAEPSFWQRVTAFLAELFA